MISKNTPHLYYSTPLLRAITAMVFLLQAFGPSFIHAQVVLDGTLGGSNGQIVGPGAIPDGATTPGGLNIADHLITQDLGTLIDNKNLFHSFQTFKITDGKSAIFTGQNSIQNIVSRVTGGSPAEIKGILGSSVSSADLFLLSPKGIIFGPNASLDVDGAFYASTADKIVFGENGIFYAEPQEENVLTSARPQAFGFIDVNPPELAPDATAGITVHGLDTMGSSLFLISRDAKTGDNPKPGIKILEGTLQSNGRSVNLVSVASNGDVSLSSFDVTSFSQLGQIDITQGATVDLNGQAGNTNGSLVIKGGRLMLNDVMILAENKAPIEGGNVLITANEVDLVSSTIKSDTSGEGDAGNITFNVNSLKTNMGVDDLGNLTPLENIEVGVTISSNSIGNETTQGGAGNIIIQGLDSTLAESTFAETVALAGATIKADSPGSGGGGTIKISSIRLVTTDTDNSGIITPNLETIISAIVNDIPQTSPAPSADPGTIFLDTTTLETDHSRFTVGTRGSRPGGSLTLKATGLAKLEDTTLTSFASGNGDGGKLDPTAGELRLGPNILIDNRTDGGGKGGELSAKAGTIEISSATIFANTLSTGPGGNISLTIDPTLTLDGKLAKITIENNSTISSNSTETSINRAGNITFTSPSIDVRSSKIESNTENTGNAGNIAFNVGTLTTDSGAIRIPVRNGIDTGVLISSSSSQTGPSGAAGTVTILGVQIPQIGEEPEVIEAATMVSLTDTTIQTTIAGTGQLNQRGDITVIADKVILKNNSKIQADTLGDSSAGAINLHASTLRANVELDGTPSLNVSPVTISSATSGSGDAGSITVSGVAASLTDAAQTLRLSETTVSTRSEGVTSGTAGNGGPITMIGQTVHLTDSEITSANLSPCASCTSGAAGDIIVKADTLTLANQSRLFSGSEREGEDGTFGFGNAGTITIAGATSEAATEVTLDNATINNAVVGGQGNDISITSNNLTLRNGTLITAETNGSSNAGDIQLNVGALVANVDATGSPLSSIAQEDRVKISSSSIGGTTSGNAGSITIQGVSGLAGSAVAGPVTLANTEISTEAENTGEGGSISINANQTLALTNSNISSDVHNTSSTEDSNTGVANISLISPTINIAGGKVSALTTGTRNAGKINIIAQTEVTLTRTSESGNADIDSRAETTATGNAGAISFNVGKLTADGAFISTRSQNTGENTGNAGDITIVGPLEGTRPSTISLTDTRLQNDVLGDGFGGSTILEASESITLNETNLIAQVKNAKKSDNNPNNTSNITITTPTLNTSGGGTIQVQSFGSRNAGTITINTNNLTTKGRIKSGELEPYRITSSSNEVSETAGAAGNITIKGLASPATFVELDNTSISTVVNSNKPGTLPANITISAQDLALNNGSMIEADTMGTAPAGTVTFNVDTLSANVQRNATTHAILLNSVTGLPMPQAGKQVKISSTGTSKGGDSGLITLRGIAGAGKAPEGTTTPATTSVDLTDPATTVALNNTLINTEVSGNPGGQGGKIGVAAQSLTLQNGTELRADTSGTGDAGDITLKAASLTASNSTISSSSTLPTENAGPAGNVNIEGVASPAQKITLNDTTIQTTIAGGTSNTAPANITISAQDLALNDGTTIIADTQGAAPAGNIILNVGELTANVQRCTNDPGCDNTPDSVAISSSSTNALPGGGDAGNVIVQDENGLGGSSASGPIYLKATRIETSVGPGGDAQGGSITLDSMRSIRLTDTVLSTNVHDAANGANTSGGDIQITTPTQLTIISGAIEADTFGTRNAGAITLEAMEINTQANQVGRNPVILSSSSISPLANSGKAGSIQTSANKIVFNETILETSIVGGNSETLPGDITTNGQDITLNNGTVFSGDTFGAAPAGSITFQAGTFKTNVDASGIPLPNLNRVTIASRSIGQENPGAAGGISVKEFNPSTPLTSVDLINADFSTTSEGTGRGGFISIPSSGDINLFQTTMSASVNNGQDESGLGAPSSDISLSTPSTLTIEGGGLIAESTGTRNAGDLNLFFGNLATKASQTAIAIGESSTTTRVLLSSSSKGTFTSPQGNQDGQAGNINLFSTFAGQPFPTLDTGIILLKDTDVRVDAANNGRGGSIILLSTGDNIFQDTILSRNVNNRFSGELPDPNNLAIRLFTPANLDIRGGGMTAQSTGARDAGAISLLAANIMTGSSLTQTPLSVGNSSPTTRVQLTTTSTGEFTTDGTIDGNAGNITLSAFDITTFTGSLSLEDTDIKTNADNKGLGGIIELTAFDTIELNHSTLASNVTNLVPDETPETDTPANISLNAPSISIIGGGITAGTRGTRGAGNIFSTSSTILSTQEGTKTVSVSGEDRTRVLLSSSSTGVRSSKLEPTRVDGKAGAIGLFSNLTTLDKTDITTDATGNGVGGQVVLLATSPTSAGQSALQLTDTDVSTTVTSLTTAETTGQIPEGPDAVISVTSPAFTMTRSSLKAETLGSRNAGIIDINSGPIELTESTISNSSQNNTNPGSGDARGIQIAGTNIEVSDTKILTESKGDGLGGLLTATGSESITLKNSTLSATVNNGTSPTAAQPSTGIQLTTPILDITGGQITAETKGTQDAGTIFLNTGTVTTRKGIERAKISSSSTNSTPGSGAAGNISVAFGAGFPNDLMPPNEITLEETDVSTDAQGDAQGGLIVMNSQGDLTLKNATLSANVTNGSNTPREVTGDIQLTAKIFNITGGRISAQSNGTRNAGGINITAEDSITTMQGTNDVEISSSSNSLAPNSGNAGSVTMTAGTLALTDANISTTVAGGGGGGSITLTATAPNTLTLNNSSIEATVQNDGPDNGVANITLTSPTINVLNNSSIEAETTGTRNAGDITLDSSDQIILNTAKISSSSTGENPESGNAGKVKIETTGLLMSTQSVISTDAQVGRGGEITLQGGPKVILDSTTISADVSGPNDGGDIVVKGGPFNAQDLDFGDEELLLRNNTVLSASSTGLGKSGNITVGDLSTGTLRIQDSRITTDASLASGGDIKLNAAYLIHVLDSEITSSVQGDSSSDGGNIGIDPEFVLIQRSAIRANANQGNGGNINIVGDVVLIDSFSSQNITASSNTGVSGNINIDSPIQNLSGAIAPLPESIVEVAALYSAQCAGQKGGQFSSFTQQGRDRIPLEPGELLPTPLFMPDLIPDQTRRPNTLSSPMAQRLQLPGLDLATLLESTWNISQGGCRS